MALATLGRVNEHGLGMRFPMAPLALGDLLVAGMAIRTGYRGVLGCTLLQHVADIIVAAGTQDIGRGLVIDHLSRPVHGMARHALRRSHLHGRAVVFVTCVTCGDVPMFISVAL